MTGVPLGFPPENTFAPVYLTRPILASQLIATRAHDLWEGPPFQILNPIDADIHGRQITSPVWTGTDAEGSTNDGLGFGFDSFQGLSTSTDGGWIQHSTNSNVGVAFPI